MGREADQWGGRHKVNPPESSREKSETFSALSLDVERTSGMEVHTAPRVCAILFILQGLAFLPLQLSEARSKASRGVVVPFVFDPKAKCDPPCQHVGLCIRNNTCFCSRGYDGDICQYVTCYPKCKNGGECLRPGKCRCPPGVGGRYCHKATCDGGCLNGGECLSINSVVKCLCSSGWMGSRCQEAICPQGCRNGGNCLAPGICNCPDGWVGGACHLDFDFRL
ncbi:von Willebrand factor D and EGF domain-containing protein isoform X2 [Scyliorhinus canicula]|uniref:von Willebrand factor D and EGF domain-containing protein isoform X2 n=1 Tax=Scyliorhinus canicula TaxID=7830 RepID=UPI0018F62EF1|nr:von Willebrand factor D and EGF domain-containing protein isoform X2 [Scyliorhinus canicula]